jgi:hypothetical protein
MAVAMLVKILITILGRQSIRHHDFRRCAALPSSNPGSNPAQREPLQREPLFRWYEF